MTNRSALLDLVHRGDFAIAYRDDAHLERVCRQLGAEQVIEALTRDRARGIARWTELAASVRRGAWPMG